MNLKSAFDGDDRGVSPVIGVILMVAITVILAAVIGSFVLDLGDSVQSAPQATFNYETSEAANGTITNITVTHEGGDSIDTARLQATGAVADGSAPVLFRGNISGDDSELTAGEEIVIGTGSNGAGNVTGEEGDTVRIVFTAEGGGSSNIISTFTLPSDGAAA